MFQAFSGFCLLKVSFEDFFYMINWFSLRSRKYWWKFFLIFLNFIDWTINHKKWLNNNEKIVSYSYNSTSDFRVIVQNSSLKMYFSQFTLLTWLCLLSVHIDCLFLTFLVHFSHSMTSHLPFLFMVFTLLGFGLHSSSSHHPLPWRWSLFLLLTSISLLLWRVEPAQRIVKAELVDYPQDEGPIRHENNQQSKICSVQ